MWNSKQQLPAQSVRMGSTQFARSSGSQLVGGSARPPGPLGSQQGGPTEAENARLQALSKQLSQLDATSSKIGETLRFISDFNNDLGHPVLQGAHASQQLQQLQSLQEKLKTAVLEIGRLQGPEAPGGPSAFPGASELSDRYSADSQRESASFLAARAAVPVPFSRTSEGGSEVFGSSQVFPASSSQLFPAGNSQIFAGSSQFSANAGGAVAGTVARFTREAAEESAANMGRLKEEQRRLQQQKKEVLDMERENEELRQELAKLDIRGLKESTALLQAQFREARAAEEELRSVEAIVGRLPQLQAEAEALRPVAAQVDAMEEQLRGLRDLDTQRLALSRDIAALQPKVLLVDKMRSRVEQLQAEVQKGEALQERLSTVQAEAERLPALRTRMYALQAGAAEARQLEKLLHEYGKQEEFLMRLQAQEEELQIRVAGIEELKHNVETLRLAASEADQLEARFTSLAATASRLPVLRSQVQQLQEKTEEVERLEAEVEKMQNVDHEIKVLRRQVEELRPKAEAVEQLLREQEHMQQLIAVGGTLPQQAMPGAVTMPTPRNSDGMFAGAVQAIVRSIASGEQHPTRHSPTQPVPVGALQLTPVPEGHGSFSLSRTGSDAVSGMASRRSTDERYGSSGGAQAAAAAAAVPPIVLKLNIQVPEEPLLPPGVSKELARRQAQTAALDAATKELAELESLEAALQAQLAVLRASPAACEVARLQAELLAMQSRDVDDLTREVEQLAGVGQRLAELKAQHVQLEQEADEVFVLQSQLPELEDAAAQAGTLRRRRDALALEVKEVRALEASIAEAEALVARRPALQSQLQALAAKKAEVEKLSAELAAETPAVEARLARVKQQMQEVIAQGEQADAMEEEVLEMKRQLAEATSGNIPTGALARAAASGSDPGAQAGANGGSGGGRGLAVDGQALLADATANAISASGSDDGMPRSMAASHGADASAAAAAVVEPLDPEEAALANHLAQVRAKHTNLMRQREELLRLTAESELLLRDNELLKMQLNVAVSMYGGDAVSGEARERARSAPGSVPGAGSGGLASVQEEDGGAHLGLDEGAGDMQNPGTPGAPGSPADSAAAARFANQASLGRSKGSELPAFGAVYSADSLGQVSGPLQSVFARIRVLESDKLELQAANEELVHELERMRSALEVSMGRLDALRGLSASINAIRGKRTAS